MEKLALKPLEGRIVGQLFQGLGNKEIAQKLNIKAHTVTCVLYQVRKRLGLKSTREIILNKDKFKGMKAC